MFTRPEKIERSDKNPYLDEINSSMRSYFSFNTQTHNFWPVYEAIKTYYPIGIRYSYPSLYTEYEGNKLSSNAIPIINKFLLQF